MPENLAPGGEYRVVGRFGYWPVLTYDPNVAATVREANSTFVWEGWNATKHTPQFRFWLDSNETEFFPGTSVAIVAHLQNTWDKAILVNTACDNPWVVFKLHRGIVQLGAMESGLRCLARTPVVVEPGAFLEHSFSWNGTILSDGFVNGEPRPQYPALPGGNYTVEGTITYWDGPLKLKTYSGNATTGVRFLAKELGEQD
ncbi:MAG: hypothetical protein HY556_00890 [Euryarchaeota archaeon]|nr:hypothetical protein [Euryarchaeota archaeon]